AQRHQLVEAWLGAFLASTPDAGDAADLPEAVAVELCGTNLPRHDSSAALSSTVDGLLGANPRVVIRGMSVRIDELLTRARTFRTERVPAYRAYQKLRNELLE